MNKRLFFLIKWIFFPGFDISTRKRMKFVKYLRTGNIKTLDAGCGNGAFDFAAVELGNRVLGIDFDAEKLKRCEEYRDYLKIPTDRCEFKVWNIYELEKLEEKFDQIICFETLEHIKDDGGVLDTFARILNQNGVLHLCTPRADRKPFSGEKISHIEDGGHVRLGYTANDFKNLLELRGFTITHEDAAVGFFGLALLSILQAVSTSPLTRQIPPRAKDAISACIFIILYPITILDGIIPSKSLNIYVRAEKTY